MTTYGPKLENQKVKRSIRFEQLRNCILTPRLLDGRRAAETRGSPNSSGGSIRCRSPSSGTQRSDSSLGTCLVHCPSHLLSAWPRTCPQTLYLALTSKRNSGSETSFWLSDCRKFWARKSGRYPLELLGVQPLRRSRTWHAPVELSGRKDAQTTLGLPNVRPAQLV